MRYLVYLALGCLVGCGTTYRDIQHPIRAQADFDVTRYLGTWYEIARYPVPFQRGCVATQATYGALDADTVTVRNTCRRNALNGPLRQITGTADLVAPGKLEVQFAAIPFLRAPYWVLWVDDAYDVAVVGVPNGRAGWILARHPHITDIQRTQADAALVANGYDPTAVIEVLQPSSGS